MSIRSPQPIPTSPPRRPRRWPWVVGGAALLLLIPVAYVAYLTWSAERELAGLMAELDATDPDWRLADLEARRSVLPDERNAALLVLRLRDRLAAANFEGKHRYQLFDELTPEAQMNEQQVENLRAALGADPELRRDLLRLKDLPAGRYPITYTDDFISTPFRAQEARRVVGFLQWDAYLRAQEEDPAGAVAACQAALHAGRSIGDEPSLTSQLVRIACSAVSVGALERVLAQGEAPEPALAAMQEAVAREVADPVLLHALCGERAGGQQLLTAVSQWKVKDTLPFAMLGNRLAHLRVTTRMVGAARLPVEEQAAAFAALEAGRGQYPVLVEQLLPAGIKVAEAHQRNQAGLRSAQVALAAERYRLRKHHWPRALDDLVQAGLLPAVPRDPYDGQPLRYRRVADGAVIYSVGYDKADNGGARIRERPLDPGSDLGFRLWDPAARRQPAPPPRDLEDGPPQE
jgi:hypothetical protein